MALQTIRVYRRFVIMLAVLISAASIFTFSNASSPASHVVTISSFEFSELSQTVQVGDKITWINEDIVPHTATAADNTWDTGELKKGESATLVVTADFTAAYYCLYHPMMKANLLIDK